jgi:hypothetical protein
MIGYRIPIGAILVSGAALAACGGGTGAVTTQSAQTTLAGICDQGSSVTTDTGSATLSLVDHAPNGTTTALTCSVDGDPVTLFVFDNSSDAQEGLSSLSGGGNQVVAGSNWIAQIVPVISGLGNAEAKIQGAFGGTVH